MISAYNNLGHLHFLMSCWGSGFLLVTMLIFLLLLKMPRREDSHFGEENNITSQSGSVKTWLCWGSKWEQPCPGESSLRNQGLLGWWERSGCSGVTSTTSRRKGALRRWRHRTTVSEAKRGESATRGPRAGSSDYCGPWATAMPLWDRHDRHRELLQYSRGKINLKVCDKIRKLLKDRWSTFCNNYWVADMMRQPQACWTNATLQDGRSTGSKYQVTS